jgi:hypothetical protein
LVVVGEHLVAYALSATPFTEAVGNGLVTNVNVNLAADGARVSTQFSTNMTTWTTATGVGLISRMNHGNGTAIFSFRSPISLNATSWIFAGVRIGSRSLLGNCSYKNGTHSGLGRAGNSYFSF